MLFFGTKKKQNKTEDMGAYLCIASNGVPPSISRRVLLHVNCEFVFFLFRFVSNLKPNGE